MTGTDSRFNSFLQPSPQKLALVAATVLLWLLIGGLFHFHGYDSTWRLWGIPTLSPYFMDLREMPAMVQALHLGLDPAVENPMDPMHRAFNYPAIWYLLAYTNLSQKDTLWLGMALLLLFFAGVFVFPGRLRAPDVLLMVLVIFSPAVMLLYERANIDLLIFFLCGFAVAANEVSTAAAVIAIDLAALLKFYPLFGLTVFLSKGKRAFLMIIAGSAAFFAIYVFIASRNVHMVWSMTPRGIDYAYGAQVLPLHFLVPAQPGLADSLLVGKVQPPLMIAILVAVELAFALGFVFWWLGIRPSARLGSFTQRNLSAFWLGASIYVGTFLLGNNWDYRLAFLIFVVPQLSEWTRDAPAGQCTAARVTMGLLLLTCWYFFYRQLVPTPALDAAFIVDEIANWSLCAGLTYFMAASLPESIRAMLVRGPARRVQAT
jgi:hypothetical protein